MGPASWSLWMLLTSNCWKSLFKHQNPTLFFKLPFEVAEMLLKDYFALILDKELYYVREIVFLLNYFWGTKSSSF